MLRIFHDARNHREINDGVQKNTTDAVIVCAKTAANVSAVFGAPSIAYTDIIGELNESSGDC